MPAYRQGAMLSNIQHYCRVQPGYEISTFEVDPPLPVLLDIELLLISHF